MSDEFVEDALQKLKSDAVRLIQYIDEGKSIGLILSKAWDVELRRRMLKKIVEEADADE